MDAASALSRLVAKISDDRGISRAAAVEEIAVAAGVSPATVRNVMRGCRLRLIDKVEGLARATGIPVEDLCYTPPKK